MAEAIKALRRMSKKLQETFKSIAYYTSRHLASSKNYGNQYMPEFKKIAAKMKKDTLKQRIKQNRKFKHDRDKLRKELNEARSKNQRREAEQKRRKGDDQNHSRSRSRSRSRSKSESRSEGRRRDSSAEQEFQRSQARYEKSKADLIEKKKERKRQGQQQKRTQIDFKRDFDFNQPYKKKKKDFTIFEQEQESKRQSQPKKKTLTKWSSRKPDSMFCTDPSKYKILKVDEQVSDFEDEDATLRVPEIMPRQPLTPYFLFLRYNRHALSVGYPQVGRKLKLGQVWKDLPEQQKQPYLNEYKRAKEIYLKKLNQYYAVNPSRRSQNPQRTANEDQEGDDETKKAQVRKQVKNGKNKQSSSDGKSGSKRAGGGQRGRGRGRGRSKKQESDDDLI